MGILSTSTLLLVSAGIMFLLRQAAQGRRAPGSGRDIAEATCGLPRGGAAGCYPIANPRGRRLDHAPSLPHRLRTDYRTQTEELHRTALAYIVRVRGAKGNGNPLGPSSRRETFPKIFER